MFILTYNKTASVSHALGKMGFPDSSAGKESACNAGDPGSVPGLGNSAGEGKATHSSILAWRICIVNGVAKSRTRLNDFHFHLSETVPL